MSLNIRKVSTKAAGTIYSQSQASETIGEWLEGQPHLQMSTKKLCANSGVKQRAFISSPSEIIKFDSVEQRCNLFLEHGKILLRSVISDVLNSDQTKIDNLIFASCTMPTIPAIDCEVIQDLKLSVANRIPLFQYGCGGGAFGLALASRLKGQRTLVASVELCSLNFQPSDYSGASLVGSAIFADGAGAVLLEESPSDSKGWSIINTQSVLLPNGTGMMGYDLKNTGNHLRLSKELPGYLSELLPATIDNFLHECNLKLNDINWWLVHPGGVKILRSLESSFKLRPEQLRFSYEVLEQYGNMSSATLLFVLNHFIESKVYQPGDYALMLGIAPGMMAELILLQFEG